MSKKKAEKDEIDKIRFIWFLMAEILNMKRCTVTKQKKYMNSIIILYPFDSQIFDTFQQFHIFFGILFVYTNVFIDRNQNKMHNKKHKIGLNTIQFIKSNASSLSFGLLYDRNVIYFFFVFLLNHVKKQNVRICCDSFTNLYSANEWKSHIFFDHKRYQPIKSPQTTTDSPFNSW